MKDLIILLRTHSRKIALAALLLLCVSQLSYVAGLLRESSTHLSIVAAFDDDARLVLDKTLKTRWYKDNGVAGYGPFYFRVTHTLASLFSTSPSSQGQTELQAKEQGAHFALLLLSALSIWALTLLLVSILTSDWVARLTLTLGLFSAFLANCFASR